MKKLIVVTIIVVVISEICKSVYMYSNNNTLQIKEERKKEDYYDEDGTFHHIYEYIPTINGGYGDNREIACILLNDQRDKWGNIPLTDNFLKKYRDKRILNDDNIINFSWRDGYHDLFSSFQFSGGDKDTNRRIICDKTDGKYSYVYNIEVDSKQWINDITIVEVTKLYDNTTGYTKDYYIKFNRENYIMIFQSIMFPTLKKNGNINRHNVALTQNFLDKYGYDKDIIENTTGVPLTRFTISDGDFDKRTFICSCLYSAQNLWKTYEVKFSLTEDGKLETIDNTKK